MKGGRWALEIFKRFRNTVLFFLKVLVIVTVTTAFIGVWQNFYQETLFRGSGNLLFIALYVAIFVVFGSIYDGYSYKP